MKKLSPSSYRALFFKHLYRFLGNVTTPRELEHFHAIGVSGGVDSMLLLKVAATLHQQGKIGPVRALFVHHHTRPGQDLDAQLVQDYCRQLGVPCVILHAEGLESLEGNFEARARNIRRKLLTQELHAGECLWLGHHLDDSYEWSLLQKYRSGQPKSSIGIPVRNGKIIRPFLCVTKDQIKRLASIEKIVFREDPTNTDVRYDRNYLREELLPIIKKRYPRFLRHYVKYSNYMAVILHLNITNRINGNQIHIYEQGAIIQGSQFSQYQVQELIHSISISERGEISSQILRMLKAIDNGKKGPFHFSGGTEIYYTSQLLMIYRQNMQNYDKVIAETLNKISDEELEFLPTFTLKDLERAWDNLAKSSDALLNMPGLVLVLENQNILKTLNTSVYDSLFPLVSEVCRARQFKFVTVQKGLLHWKNKKSRLPEKLRLLPLWTLSNLFSSQE